MHAIYTTPGFIIESRPRGEAGRLLSIFTRDFGLILASAQGIRLEKSKLRYHTLEYSLGEFSLVRGREFWRLTSAQEQGVRSTEHGEGSREKEVGSSELGASQLIARIAFLLKRLLQGEAAHPELFVHVEACVKFLKEMAHVDGGRPLTADQLSALESLTVLRMLHALGYVGTDASVAFCFDTTAIDLGLLERVSATRALLNQHINKALRESHL